MGSSDDAVRALAAARRRRRVAAGRRGALEWVVAVGVAVVAALVIKTWVAQAFVIPSGSMENTLLVGDRVLVSKLSYRLGDVDRGDVIVFDNPTPQPGQPGQLIKRVVAVGGDTVAAADGRLIVNGEVQDEPWVKPDAAGAPGTTTMQGACGRYRPDEEIVVPDGHVFVLGDNRGQSLDGRCYGPVDEDEIVGHAFVRLWPVGRIGLL
ncbi:MAG: signal peptidase I [Actinobacteria bacterium]|nr:signal peptidase I [Actinomycetota bacterium]